jgi:hypothetical protein
MQIVKIKYKKIKIIIIIIISNIIINYIIKININKITKRWNNKVIIIVITETVCNRSIVKNEID